MISSSSDSLDAILFSSSNQFSNLLRTLQLLASKLTIWLLKYISPFFSILLLRIRFKSILNFSPQISNSPSHLSHTQLFFLALFPLPSLSSPTLSHPSSPTHLFHFSSYFSETPRSSVSLWDPPLPPHSLLRSRGFDLDRLGEIAPRARADSSPLPVVPSTFLFDRLPSIHYNRSYVFFDRFRLCVEPILLTSALLYYNISRSFHSCRLRFRSRGILLKYSFGITITYR